MSAPVGYNRKWKHLTADERARYRAMSMDRDASPEGKATANALAWYRRRQKSLHRLAQSFMAYRNAHKGATRQAA